MGEVRLPRVTILGLGLMGGSLSWALTRAGYDVTGWDRDRETVLQASRIGVVSRACPELSPAVADAELVFVATPVRSIAAVISDAVPFTRPGTIFSDLGSVKEAVIAQVTAVLPQDRFFVPGHPMTGSEQQGIDAADPFLFQNAAYILMEDPRTPPALIQLVATAVKATGAHLLMLSAAEHDRIVALVSHLPHLLAATLAKTAGSEEENHPGTLNLAAGGFRDTTRIATGSPALWEEIVLANRDKVLTAIDAFQKELDSLKQVLGEADGSGLRQFLQRGRETRLQIPAKNKGFLTLLHEMVVTVEDKPGTIDAVLRHLAQAGLNIKDIEILRVREGDGGTLRLALENEAAVEEAVRVLSDRGFKARKR